MNPPFTAAEKALLLLRLVFLTPWTLAYFLCRSSSIALYRGLPLWRYLVCAFLKVVLATLSSRELQYLSTPTRKVYDSWVRRKLSEARGPDASDVRDRLQHDAETLDDGRSALLWIGNRRAAKKFVLFFHGGGYMVHMLPAHLEWCWRAYVTAGMETGTETAVAVLEYTLGPEAQYPVQFNQALAGLSHMLASGIQARDIFIGGDSVGGQLASQLLSHLCETTTTTTTSASTAVKLKEPLAGAFLVSPLVSNKFTHASYTQNVVLDMLSVETVKKLRVHFLGLPSTEDVANKAQTMAYPLDRDLSHMKKMSQVVKDLYITVGDEEVLRDQGVVYAAVVRKMNPDLKIRLDVQKGMAHDFILLECLDGVDGPCVRDIRGWAATILGAD
ncbi:hypothetical protein EsDP_00007125 [Epichloe bromicola]|uniref:Alpha/beta hydrolase fold-3 domain-containing protein n=1 Tax=Epichloe bromicola TaxID=79588 RepID=A0ABQ0CZM8_9HYPO